MNHVQTSRLADASSPRRGRSSPQAVYWIGTLPESAFVPQLPDGCAYIRGQLETGSETGFVHWQILVVTQRKRRLGWLRSTFGPYHFEPTRSAAANDYVWKEDTRVEGSQFEFGELPVNRNSKPDWDRIWESARAGDLGSVPSDVRIRCYNQLRRIESEAAVALPMQRSTVVYWGPCENGKSRLATEHAGPGYFPKDPTSKWFGRYRGESTCVVDDYRGAWPVCDLLRWLDRYPVYIEDKFNWHPLNIERWYFTSNVHPRDWYPSEPPETIRALLRRMRVIYVPLPMHDLPLMRDREDEVLLPPVKEADSSE